MPRVDHPDLPTLETERLRLRWLRPDDSAALDALISDPEVRRYWGGDAYDHGVPALLEQIREGRDAESLFQWGVARKDDDALIGCCVLAGLDWPNQRAEIGFALARRFWGAGLMAEACRALLAFGFDTLGLHRIEADVDPRNGACIRLLERLGFTREGLLRERWWVSEEWQDSVMYGLLAAEWRGALAAPAPGARTARPSPAG